MHTQSTPLPFPPGPGGALGTPAPQRCAAGARRASRGPGRRAGRPGASARRGPQDPPRLSGLEEREAAGHTPGAARGAAPVTPAVCHAADGASRCSLAAQGCDPGRGRRAVSKVQSSQGRQATTAGAVREGAGESVTADPSTYLSCRTRRGSWRR